MISGASVREYTAPSELKNSYDVIVAGSGGAGVSAVIAAKQGGAATSVKVTVGGKEKTISAKAVVDATGGFGADMDMITELKSELDGYVTTNHEGVTGDGISRLKTRCSDCST